MFGVRIHKITGNSMMPTYNDGDYVLSVSQRFCSSLGRGDVVLLEHATYGRLIKRIFKISGAGLFSMHGDSDESISHETLGVARTESIVGKVILKISGKGLPA